MKREELERLTDTCWRDFPRECKGCDNYRERVEGTDSLFIGILIPSYSEFIGPVVVKECKKYHKKVVEKV